MCVRQQTLPACADDCGQPGIRQPRQRPSPAGVAGRRNEARAAGRADVLPTALHQGQRQGLHHPYIGLGHPARGGVLRTGRRQEAPARGILLCGKGVQGPGRCATGTGLF